MIKVLLIFMLTLLSSNIYANIEELKDIITDPAVSRRCKALLNERTDKIKVQQKLGSMLLRNDKLQKKLRDTQKTLKTRLELNYIQIKNNLRLSRMRLKSMEENIVRKGCPGITL